MIQSLSFPRILIRGGIFLKVVYPICCGVDVHKTFLVGTIISTTDGVQPHYQKKRFSTYNSDLHRFADWLHANNCLDVCMESTGKYWVPMFNILAIFQFICCYRFCIITRQTESVSRLLPGSSWFCNNNTGGTTISIFIQCCYIYIRCFLHYALIRVRRSDTQ